MDRALAPAPLREEPFRQLVARLCDQHEADIESAVKALGKENARLREENERLHEQIGSACATLGDRSQPPWQPAGGAGSEADWAALVPTLAPPGVPDHARLLPGSLDVTSSSSLLPELSLPGAAAGHEQTSQAGDQLDNRLESGTQATSPRMRSCTSARPETGRRVSLWFDGESRGEVIDLPGPAGVGLSTRIPVGELSRFCEMFDVSVSNTSTATISAEQILRVLEQKGLPDLAGETVSWVVSELQGCAAKPSLAAQRMPQLPERSEFPSDPPLVLHSRCSEPSVEMPFRRFLAVMFAEDVDVDEGLGTKVVEEVKRWRQALLTEGIDEVIARVTGVARTYGNRTSVERRQARVSIRRQSTTRRLKPLNFIVTFTLVVSLISNTLRLDLCDSAASCSWWLFIECACVTVFVAEFLMKCYVLGASNYLFGRACWWNWGDVVITTLQLFDVMITLILTVGGESRFWSSVGGLALPLRSLRILRFARVLKLRGTPLLHDLSNMLSGFLIGMPALLWVVVLIMILLWMSAIGFRHVIGSRPDDIHAEEYCPDVLTCMFTVFRCVIGDCSSKEGRSLPANFVSSYGYRFMIAYYIGMVTMVFGVFNIITAVFVESTMKGVAADDAKIKLQTTYKARQVKKNMEELAKRICTIQTEVAHSTITQKSPLNLLSAMSWATLDGAERECTMTEASHVALSERTFYITLQDDRVQRILGELDIDVSASPSGIFAIFKVDDRGEVPLPELLSTLMKLRGSTSKVDLVAPSVAISSLQDEIQDTQRMITRSHQALLEGQRALAAAVAQPAAALARDPQGAVRGEGSRGAAPGGGPGSRQVVRGGAAGGTAP